MQINKLQLKEKLTDEVLKTIMEVSLFLQGSQLTGLVDQYEADNFVTACYSIAEKKIEWPNQKD